MFLFVDDDDYDDDYHQHDHDEDKLIYGIADWRKPFTSISMPRVRFENESILIVIPYGEVQREPLHHDNAYVALMVAELVTIIISRNLEWKSISKSRNTLHRGQTI